MGANGPPADVARKHAQAYRDGSHGDEDSLGAAAAMQALKTLAQNNGGGGGGSSGMGGQGAFLAVAMSEASKVCHLRAFFAPPDSAPPPPPFRRRPPVPRD